MSIDRVHFIFVGQDVLAAADGSPEGRLGYALSDGQVAALSGGLRETALVSRDYEWSGRRFRAMSFAEAAFENIALTEAASAHGDAPLGFSLRRVPVRQAIGELGTEQARPVLRGLALVRWLENARHCGACGAPLEDCPPEREGDGEGLGGRSCPACGRIFFPRISPAVILLIRKEGKILLAHNARFPAGRFGLIAGFVEAGETIEEMAAREAREEAGIDIRDLRYRRSQPWPFPDSLMLAFTADWAGGVARPDGVEIEELRWCGPDELPSIPPPGSVARSLIDEFVAQSARA